jgi:hypothetical protein
MLLGLAMATRRAMGDEIPAWFRSRLASSDFCALCEVVHSDTRVSGMDWKIVRLYRGHQAILNNTPVLKSSARLLLLFSRVGDRGLLITCRSRVPVFLQPWKTMPLLNRRTPSNPDGSLIPLGTSREETGLALQPVQDGGLKISLNEEAKAFDPPPEDGDVTVSFKAEAKGAEAPQARIPLARIAALFQKRHRGRRADSAAHGRRPVAMSHLSHLSHLSHRLHHDKTTPRP